MDPTEFDEACLSPNHYRLWAEDAVRFNDLDAIGHVGSVRMGEFFATARTLLFQLAIPEWPRSNPVPMLKLSIVRHDGEIGYPQALRTGLLVERFGNTSFQLVLGLFADETCAALSRNVFVFVDPAMRKSSPPETAIRERFLAYGA